MRGLKKIFCIMLILVIVSGCIGIGKEEAEKIASDFVRQKVKFFANEEGAATDLPQYSIEGVTSYEEDGSWIVLMHVSAELDGEVKDNDLAIKVNSKGRVTELNGQEVPEE